MTIAEREIMATNGARNLWFKMIDMSGVNYSYSWSMRVIALAMGKTETELMPAMDYLVENGFVSRAEQSTNSMTDLPLVYSVIRFK